MIHHAVVDAIYAAKLCRERGLPALAVAPMVATPLPLYMYLINMTVSLYLPMQSSEK